MSLQHEHFFNEHQCQPSNTWRILVLILPDDGISRAFSTFTKVVYLASLFEDIACALISFIESFYQKLVSLRAFLMNHSRSAQRLWNSKEMLLTHLLIYFINSFLDDNDHF